MGRIATCLFNCDSYLLLNFQSKVSDKAGSASLLIASFPHVVVWIARGLGGPSEGPDPGKERFLCLTRKDKDGGLTDGLEQT